MPSITKEDQLYKIQDDLVISINGLSDKIVCIFYSQELKQFVITDNFNKESLEALIKKLNLTNLEKDAEIQIKLIGGNKGSSKSLESLMTTLQEVEKVLIKDSDRTDLFNIVTNDTCEIPHPDAIQISCTGENIVIEAAPSS